MRVIKSILIVWTLFALGGCNSMFGLDKAIINFYIKNESSLRVQNIQIELDDGGSKSSNIFDTIKYSQIDAGSSANLSYKFESTQNGEGLYRIAVKLSNGKQLSKEFGYFDSSLNISKDYFLSIKEDKILLTK